MNWQIVMVALSLLPMGVILAFVYFSKLYLDRDKRRDPITTELRVLPAAAVQAELDQGWDLLQERFVTVVLIGSVCASSILVRRVPGSPADWGWFDSLMFLSAMAISMAYGLKTAREMPGRRRMKQGLRAEQACAQELGTVLAGNNRIVHDVHCGGFNIDHVVVTSAGVFAVETKSRLKPPMGSGSDAVRVKYDGKRLEFPGWVETEPIEQAKRQARWLEKYLAQATGDRFAVTAVLALPGWYVENSVRISDQMVRVVNPKNTQWLLLPNRDPVLETAAVQRAAFAIEKLAAQATREIA